MTFNNTHAQTIASYTISEEKKAKVEPGDIDDVTLGVETLFDVL